MDEIGKVDESSWFFRNVVERRVALGYVGAVVFLLFACPTRLSVFVGFVPAFLGEALRTWSSGVILKRKALATEGPYRLVRNPLYVGNFLLALGASLMAGRFWLVVVCLGVFVPMYRGLVAKEEKFLLKKYAEVFEEYCRTVPRFVPRHLPWPLPAARYDVRRMFVKHREWQAWAALYAGTLYLLFRAH